MHCKFKSLGACTAAATLGGLLVPTCPTLAPPRNALWLVPISQLLPTPATAAPARPRIRVPDAQLRQLPRKVIPLVPVASRSALRAGPPINFGVLLVDLPLEVLAVPGARDVDVPVPGRGLCRGIS
ncbi:hypothetical protein VTI28DRAFT_8449 [Corynascus sepedonium]